MFIFYIPRSKEAFYDDETFKIGFTQLNIVQRLR